MGDTDNGTFQVVENQLRTAAAFDYESKSSYSLRVRTTDQGGLSTEKVLTVQVTDVNEAPYVAAPLPDQNAGANRVNRWVVEADAFADQDAGQTLSYTATQADGSPLPAWLSFEATTRTLAGRPLVRDVGQIRVRLTASDSGSPALAAAAEFTVTVASVPFAWQNADLPEDVDGDSLVLPLDVLQLINWINERGSGELTSLGPDPASTPPLFLDVNGDKYLTPSDVLGVITYINNRSTGSSEGEGVADVGISAPVGAQGIPAWSAAAAEEGNSLPKLPYTHPAAVWDGFSAGTAAVRTCASRETALAELPALDSELDSLLGDIASEVDRRWHSR